MDINITISNYRGFSSDYPARFLLSPGWTSLVGMNNAGKSIILKFFFDFRRLFDFLSIQPVLYEGKKIKFDDYSNNMIVDIEEIFNKNNLKDIEIEIEINSQNIGYIKIVIERKTKDVYVSKIGENNINNRVPNRDFVITGDFPHGFCELGIGSYKFGNLGPFLKCFRILKRVIYIPSFRNILNSESDEKYYDIETGKRIVEIWGWYKTGSSISKQKKAIKVIDILKSFLKCSTLELNPSYDKKTLILVIDQMPYNLIELGSGITQIVFNLISIYFDEFTYVLIDEPELGLHPALQIDFLKELHRSSKFGVVFTTHNIGLARQADKVYSVKKDKDNKNSIIENYNAEPNLVEFLGSLGYMNYEILGFDRVILVEGVTDVKTIQAFLRKKKCEYKFLIFPLGGSALIRDSVKSEILEIKKISQKIFVLIDSEKKSQDDDIESARVKFKNMCEDAKIHCHILERRAIENYFVKDAINKVKRSDKYKELMPFEKLGDINPAWRKGENWQIAEAMNIDDIKNTDLDVFLNECCKDI